MQLLNPSISLQAKDAVRAIAASFVTDHTDTHADIYERLSQLYGDLSGQRAVSGQLIEEYSGSPNGISTHDFVMGLEIYFSILCHLLSAAALSPNQGSFLADLASLPDKRFAHRILAILNGTHHSEEGVNSFRSTLEGDWLSDRAVERLTPHLKNIVGLLLKEVEIGEFDGLDPLQSLHSAVFPANLSHVTGQFYTPPWLAQLVLNSVGWDPSEKLIDPFCGSGVFLITALETAVSKGYSISDVAPSLIGIDLSPTAVCAAKTNLLLAYVRHEGRSAASTIPINILCADSLAPTISKGQQLGQGLFAEDAFVINGKAVPAVLAPGNSTVATCLDDNGIALSRWQIEGSGRSEKRSWSTGERQAVEQIAAYRIGPADVLVTNPPWVGWEYISRNYRDRLTPAWNVYDLFEQRGLKAAFLKEDLSTLCVPAALDNYLAAGGRAGLVLRQSTMKSDLAGKGVRRLSIFKDKEPLELTQIHDLGKLNVFESAAAPAAVWILNKGKATQFPVKVSSWSSASARSVPVRSELAHVLETVNITEEFCRPLSMSDPEGRWTFDHSSEEDPIASLKGQNAYKPRIGFFTGGANAVYYLSIIKNIDGKTSTYRNIIERARREAPEVTIDIEDDLVYPVIRGRDVSYWSSKTEVFALCPHTKETKIKPIGHSEMWEVFPKAMTYLTSMKDLLDLRNGFAGWEKKTKDDYFYAIQRIGDYTFSPYKVCWSYISDDFVIAVCGSNSKGKAMLPNDKVVFLPAATREEAYFVAGLLSFNVIRSSVISSVAGRQISANVIRQYSLPQFNKADNRHLSIALVCEAGHLAVARGDNEEAESVYNNLNSLCADLLEIPTRAVEDAASRIEAKLGYYPFKGARKKRASRIER
ncbi:hypothetical protein ELG79_22090 [Rhizobium leguminosarum]|uniref:N-6 DNA methylase n=1 Tax=Rhizobium leguminosarum TaxID=384 RepID=UPI00102F5BA3|nr:N-6 DNA methylase [Rhizobium leguminosarum]TBG27780.1 hypothetical protein ELG79_22090 [Rhizobium leguminosarum]